MFKRCATSLTISDLNDVETTLGFKLPRQFKDHYLQFNGGSPDKSYYYAEDIDLETEIAVFFPVKYYTNSDLLVEKIYMDLTNRDVIPKKYLPFADDLGGNFFCIDLEKESIVLIWMDYGEVTDSCINLLADSFSEFINNLEKCEDDEDDYEED